MKKQVFLTVKITLLKGEQFQLSVTNCYANANGKGNGNGNGNGKGYCNGNVNGNALAPTPVATVLQR